MIVCTLILAVCANHYYSFNELISTYPVLKNIDKRLFLLIIVTVLSSLILILKVISLAYREYGYKRIDPPVPVPAENGDGEPEDRQLQQTTISRMSKLKFINEKGRMFTAGAIVLVVVILLAVIFLATYSFLLLIRNKTGIAQIDIYEIVATCTGYGISLLFILAALFFIVVVLIEVISYILKKIRSLLKFRDEYAAADELSQRSSSKIKEPTYAFSIIIFFALLYMSYKISGYNLDKLYNAVAGGEYLALPLTLLVGIVAFFIFVRLIHGIILLILKGRALRIEVYVIRIGKLVVSILYRSIITALTFIKFIPDFFEALHGMVLMDEDDISEDSDISASNNKENNESRKGADAVE
jgi:hypothetical protein